MPDLVKIATVDDIPVNEVRAFEYEDRRIAIYHCGDAFYATTDICSHAYAELARATSTAMTARSSARLHGSTLRYSNRRRAGPAGLRAD